MTLGNAVAKRIDEYLFSEGISLYKLSQNSGIPLSTLKNLYRNHTKSPTLTVIFKIAKSLNIDYLTFLDSEIFRNEEINLE